MEFHGFGLKRGLGDDIVVSSYGSIMAITDYPKDVLINLKKLEEQEMFDKYGFYDAIDYTPERLDINQKYSPVKSYMAHHQGLILLSLNNFFNSNILQKRFSKNPEIEAVNILLEEVMPEKTIITNEKKEEVKKLKYKDYENGYEKIITKLNPNIINTNVISNGFYTVAITDKGVGYSKFGDICINRFKPTSDETQGILFYIKNIRSKRIWTSGDQNYLSKADKYSVSFKTDSCKFVRTDGNIETTTKIVVSTEDNIEIRRIELKNNGNMEEMLEITPFLEPILSRKEADYAHKAFNNLFLSYDLIDNETIVVTRKKREKDADIFMAVNFFSNSDTIGELEFEIDKEKFVGRNNFNVPKMVEESRPLTKNIGIVTDPIIAFKRTVKLSPNESIILDLCISVANTKEEVLELVEKYKNIENISRTFDMAKARADLESKFLNLKGQDIETYGKIFSYLMYQNKTKKLNRIPSKTYSNEGIWKFGISGDLPIILVKIKEIHDIEVVEELIKAHEFLRTKNIIVDLVILDEEKNVYEQTVNSMIEGAILNNHINYLKNISGGIFIIKPGETNEEEKQILNLRANIIFDASIGKIKSQINDIEEEYLDSIKNIGVDNTNIINHENYDNTIQINMENLKYYNEYGGFSADGKEYIIKTNENNKLPTVWSHVLSNPNFGTVVTDNKGGYTWSKNSRLNRLTAWANNPVTDTPSEIIYIKDKDLGKAWTFKEERYVIYGFGYAKYIEEQYGITKENVIFVGKEEKIKINLCKFKNNTKEKRKLKIIYYIKPVMGEDEIKTNGFINIQKENGLIYAKNIYRENFKNSIMYVSSSEKIVSFTGNKDWFIGNKTLEYPEGLDKVCLDNENSFGQNSCIAIELAIELDPLEEKEISICLGEEDNLINVKDMAYKYSKIQNCKEELEDVKKFWDETLGKIEVNTPIESMNILLNGWMIYQTIACRLWARTGYYQSGGALGFRDQLQDTLCLKMTEPEYLKNQIYKHAKHQFIEGDVEHWWHEETSRGIRTKFSDDLLWLPYSVAEYIETTGDYKILNTEIPYIQGEPLGEHDEKYDKHEESNIKGSIYEHCIKAIEKSINFGIHGLPKIGSGDWNDGMNTVGNKGIGESVWLRILLL